MVVKPSGSSLGCLIFLGLFLVFPTANYVWSSGLPLSSLPELIAVLALLPLICSRWLRRLWFRHVSRVFKGNTKILVLVLGLGLVGKAVLFTSGSYQGFPACYRAVGETPSFSSCEKSYNNPLGRFAATRVDNFIDFGSDDWELSFMNSLRFNYYWWVADSVLRDRIPFMASWQGVVDFDAPQTVNVAYVGTGQLEIGPVGLRLLPTYSHIANEQLQIPKGRHNVNVTYIFDDGRRSSMSGEPGPYPTLRLNVGNRPISAIAPHLAFRLIGWFLDLLALTGLLLLIGFYWSILKSQWFCFMGVTVLAFIVYVQPLSDPPSAINSYVFLFTLVAAMLVVWSRRRHHLLMACAGMAILILAHEVRAHPSLTAVLLRDGGRDFLTYESFARSILETWSLRAGEDIFYFQALSRYVTFFHHLVFGDGDGQVTVFSRVALTSALLWFGWRFRGCNSYGKLVIFSGTVLLVTFVNSTVVATWIRQGTSEYPTWLLFPFAFTWLFASGQKSTARGFAALSATFIARTNQAPAILWLFIFRGWSAFRKKDWRLVPALGLAVLICLLPALHNKFYGGEFTVLPTSRDIPENLVIPPDRWLDAQTDQEARRQVIEQLDFLLYGSTTGARHVLAGGELRFVFLGFQLLWIIALGLASQRLWRFREVSILVMAALPLVYLAPHLFYQVDVYYPRHVVIGYLAMAAVAFYAVTAPTLKNSDT